MADELHDDAAARLAAVDQRYTANRRAIVEALSAQSAPVTLPELVAARPELRVSSTYRNLAALADAGVVRRLVGAADHAHYELAEHLTEHHHHLVCLGCGAIEDVTLDGPLERRLDAACERLARGRDFEPVGHAIDIQGRCRDCRQP